MLEERGGEGAGAVIHGYLRFDGVCTDKWQPPALTITERGFLGATGREDCGRTLEGCDVEG